MNQTTSAGGEAVGEANAVMRNPGAFAATIGEGYQRCRPVANSDPFRHQHVGMSGLELLPKAKAVRPDVPIIMITAYGDPS